MSRTASFITSETVTISGSDDCRANCSRKRTLSTRRRRLGLPVESEVVTVVCTTGFAREEFAPNFTVHVQGRDVTERIVANAAPVLAVLGFATILGKRLGRRSADGAPDADLGEPGRNTEERLDELLSDDDA